MAARNFVANVAIDLSERKVKAGEIIKSAEIDKELAKKLLESKAINVYVAEQDEQEEEKAK